MEIRKEFYLPHGYCNPFKEKEGDMYQTLSSFVKDLLEVRNKTASDITAILLNFEE